MKYLVEKNKITIYDTADFNIEHILECGQVFRYKKLDNCYEVYSKFHKATIFSQKVVTICCDDEKYFEKYFDFATDYAKIKLALRKDGLLEHAIDFGYGIRILNQDKLEAIISFIISANNNIPRIKQIIENIWSNVVILDKKEILFQPEEIISNIKYDLIYEGEIRNFDYS